MSTQQITHEVIAQLQKQQELYRQQHKARVKIVGFGSNCCKFEFNARGFTFEELLSRIEQCKKNATPHNAGDKYAGAPSLEQLDALQDMPIPMLIDCSGQSSPKDLYAACLERGIHVSLILLMAPDMTTLLTAHVLCMNRSLFRTRGLCATCRLLRLVRVSLPLPVRVDAPSSCTRLLSVQVFL